MRARGLMCVRIVSSAGLFSSGMRMCLYMVKKTKSKWRASRKRRSRKHETEEPNLLRHSGFHFSLVICHLPAHAIAQRKGHSSFFNVLAGQYGESRRAL